MTARQRREHETHVTRVECAPCGEVYEWPGKQPANYVCRICGEPMRATIARVMEVRDEAEQGTHPQVG